MRGFTGLFFISLSIFLTGCYTGGKSEESKQRIHKPCTCNRKAQPDLAKWDAAHKKRSGGNIAIRIDSEPGLLLSMFSAHPAATQIIDHNVMEALVDLDPKTGQPIPELAAYWVNNPTHTSFTFHLVDDATWHDGQPFTSADVAFTFRQLLDPAGGAVIRSKFEDVSNVEASEDNKVVIDLDRPRPNFVADVSKIMMLPAHILKNTTIVKHPIARAPLGTGPFQFSDWKMGQHIVIERSPRWRGEPMALSKITYRIVSEHRVALELFKGKRLDIMTDAENTSFPAAHTIDHPEPKFNAWIYNTRSPYFSDARTRRAMSKLIDRDAIACSIMNCLATPIFSPWPDIKVNNSQNQFAPQEARALLKKAGWRDSDEDGVLDKDGQPFSFSLLLPDSDVTQKRAVTVIVHDMHKAGIKVNLTVVSWAVYADRLRKHRFDATIMAVSTAPPFDAEELFHTNGIRSGRNFGQFSDQKIDALFDQLKTELNTDTQRSIRTKIVARLETLQPLSFTFHPYKRVLVRKNIHGLHIGPNGINEKKLWVEKPRRTQR